MRSPYSFGTRAGRRPNPQGAATLLVALHLAVAAFSYQLHRKELRTLWSTCWVIRANTPGRRVAYRPATKSSLEGMLGMHGTIEDQQLRAELLRRVLLAVGFPVDDQRVIGNVRNTSRERAQDHPISTSTVEYFQAGQGRHPPIVGDVKDVLGGCCP
jgi:hypothetical protein